MLKPVVANLYEQISRKNNNLFYYHIYKQSRFFSRSCALEISGCQSLLKLQFYSHICESTRTSAAGSLE